MTSPSASARITISDAEIVACLTQEWLAQEPGSRSIVTLTRRPFEYTSSFPLEELDVELSDGGRVALILKNLSVGGLSEKARRAKPRFLDAPLREIAVYRQLLSQCAVGMARYYGAFTDSATERFAIVIEKIAGTELYQIGDTAVWDAAARWLATFHAAFASVAAVPPAIKRELLLHNRRYYEAWLERAASFLTARAEADEPSDVDRESLANFRQLAAAYPHFAKELSLLPQTIIHGEFYASNVLVADPCGPKLRVCPIDWERTAVGPGVIDLAALTAGRWSERQKLAFAERYWHALPRERRGYGGWEEFQRGLWLARLHLAVQWLGWSDDWRPPSEHRQDWLQEALAAWTALG